MVNIKTKIEENTILRVILLSIGSIFLSALFYLFSTILQHNFWSNLFLSFSGLIIASGTVTVLWDIFVKRSFMDEILVKTGISRSLYDAGVVNVYDNFYTDKIDWPKLFNNANELYLFVSWAYTWRESKRALFNEMVSKKPIKIRIILPDPEVEMNRKEMSRRFNLKESHIKNNIEEAARFYRKLKDDNDLDSNEIQLWYISRVPLFTFYKFDNSIILAFFNHQKDKSSVPALMIEGKDKILSDFVRREIEIMTKEDPNYARQLW